jgi:signal transduction histidine kinase
MTSTALPAVPLGQRVWSETWRVAVAALTGLLTAGIVWPTMDTRGWSDLHVGALILGDLGAGLAALVLLPFRHRAPLLITVVIAALSSVSTLAVGAAAIATVSLATRRRAVELAVAGAVLLGATVLYDVVLAPPADDMPLWQILVAGVVGIALLVVIGIAIGQRRALLLSLRERAALLERDQQLREDRAREQERAHIAREMHDVLGHRLSLVALHAGALEYRGPGLTPDETAAAAGVVRAEAHSALTDLRDVLGVLRDPAVNGDEVTGTAPPQPTLVDLPDLLDQARAGGATVRARVDADGAAVPTAVGRHAYRIVQESLTNARRHAPGEPVDVVVETVPGPGVRVVVSNTLTDGPARADASGKTAGHGLRGLAERARLVGGSFRAGSDDGHVHVVEAVLPWTP